MVVNFNLLWLLKGSVGVMPVNPPIVSGTVSYLELFIVDMGPGSIGKLKINP